MLRMVLILFTVVSMNAFAVNKKWHKIYIPGATCGDGQPYPIYINKRSPKKLQIHLQGGGVCWNKSTCFGPNLRAWMHEGNKPSKREEANLDRNPLSGHTKIIFDYCTGDIYGGSHIALYKGGKAAYHNGAKNIALAIDYIKKNKLVDLQKTTELVQTGTSAGAIGTLLHGYKFEKIFKSLEKKSMILDSPGLHWGANFWNKFTEYQMKDFANISAALDINLMEYGGMVVKNVPKFCDFYRDWNMGFMQTSKDIIMSLIFGNILPSDHERSVYGPDGLVALTENVENCATFAPSSYFHTLFRFHDKKHLIIYGKSIDSFITDILEGDTKTNYRHY